MCLAALCRTTGSSVYLREALLKRSISAEVAIKAVLESWQAAEPYPDVAPGLRALHAAGIQVGVLWMAG